MARRKFPKHVEFHTCDLDSTERDAVVLKAITSTGEEVYIRIPFWGVGCVSRSIKSGLDEGVRLAISSRDSFVKGATS